MQTACCKAVLKTAAAKLTEEGCPPNNNSRKVSTTDGHTHTHPHTPIPWLEEAVHSWMNGNSATFTRFPGKSRRPAISRSLNVCVIRTQGLWSHLKKSKTLPPNAYVHCSFTYQRTSLMNRYFRKDLSFSHK